MPTIKDSLNFAPKKNALSAWLKTRKDDKSFAGYVLDGFFNTHLFVWDAFFTIFALGIEFVIFIFFMNLVDPSEISNWIALPVIAFIDFCCIFLVHFNKSGKVKYNNARRFIGEINLTKRENIVNNQQLKEALHLKRNDIFSYIGVTFEVVSCCVKIYFLEIAYGLSLEPISIGIVVGYIFQTFAYIFCAGYFFWEIITSWFFIDYQYKKYKDMEGDKNNPYTVKKGHDAPSVSFETAIKLSLENCNTDRFQLSKDEDKDNTYTIKCIGIPIDQDIIDFASKQPERITGAQHEIMKQAHRLQLIIYITRP
ncbi:MAG: hypothetical protein OHK0038_26200 [Flammeovirgaceae bacterium]